MAKERPVQSSRESFRAAWVHVSVPGLGFKDASDFEENVHRASEGLCRL